MSPRGLTQVPRQEDTEREIVDVSAEEIRIAAGGLKVGQMIGRADMLSEIIRHVNAELNTGPDDYVGMPQEWLNGRREALHQLGLWLAGLSAKETS